MNLYLNYIKKIKEIGHPFSHRELEHKDFILQGFLQPLALKFCNVRRTERRRTSQDWYYK